MATDNSGVDALRVTAWDGKLPGLSHRPCDIYHITPATRVGSTALYINGVGWDRDWRLKTHDATC